MYRHKFTVTIDYIDQWEDHGDNLRRSVQRAIREELLHNQNIDGIEAISLGQTETTTYVRPNDPISHARLAQYHIAMKSAGFTTHDARAAYRRAVLGRNIAVASTLTNQQFEAIMKHLGVGVG